MMKAVYYDQQGDAAAVLKIGRFAIPEPGAGDVLVRVHSSGCNPSDAKLRAGSRAMGFAQIIPHSDGAGVITEVGPGVDPARLGQRVWLWNAQWQRGWGTCAEYIALPAEQAVVLPDHISYDAGACLGVPAMTAHHCVLCDGSVEGKTILVTGGAGTVSRYAIQIAKLSGALVVTTVSTEEKAAYARDAGADFVVNYKTGKVGEEILDLTGGVDRIVEMEFGVNLPGTMEVLKPSGIIATYGSAGEMAPTLPFYPLLFKNVTLHMVLVYLLGKPARMAATSGLTALLEQGRLSHSFTALKGLDACIEAHQIVEKGTKLGSCVLSFANDD